VYALVRGRDQGEADARLRETIASLLGTVEPWSRRVVAVPADLCAPEMGLDRSSHELLAERTSLFVHCAASVSFELGVAESREINVEGTRRLLDLAALCADRGGLECFTHISTAYVAGTHSGRFAETDLYMGQDFRNPYELSKYEGEAEVRQRATSLPYESNSLPVQVLRPSIVVGNSHTGWTPTFNVLYSPLRAFARGTYPALPARLSAPVDVVPVDYVADAILALAGRPGTTYHLVAGNRASSVGELADLASSYLERTRPPVIPPGLYRRILHPLLVRTGDERRKRALRRSEQFFPYFEIDTHYDDRLAREALAPYGIKAPPLRTYFKRLMDYARAADWGRRPIPRSLLRSSVPRATAR
jgi:long-chain acyl-CoA synthetase